MNKNARIWFAISSVFIATAIGMMRYGFIDSLSGGVLAFGIYSFGCGIGFSVRRDDDEEI